MNIKKFKYFESYEPYLKIDILDTYHLNYIKISKHEIELLNRFCDSIKSDYSSHDKYYITEILLKPDKPEFTKKFVFKIQKIEDLYFIVRLEYWYDRYILYELSYKCDQIDGVIDLIKKIKNGDEKVPKR